MTRSFEPLLAAAGFDEHDAKSRAALMDAVTSAHEGASGTSPRWCYFVPGRVEVFGKHTDYAGGHSLVGAVPRGMAVAASARDDGVVSVADIARGQRVQIPCRASRDVEQAPPNYAGWTNYVNVTIQRLAANFPDAALGADITVQSDLPSAAGMSSSSVLIVGLAALLIKRAGIDGREDWRVAIHDRLDLAGYLAALEAGADFGPYSGNRGVGTHGGSEDHVAILASRARQLTAFRFVPITSVGACAMPADWRFVIGVSGVPADKTGAARERFNRLSASARSLVDLWNNHHASHHRTLREVTASSPDAAAELAGLVLQSPVAAIDRDLLRKRLEHFVREDRRVLQALEAFRSPDEAALAGLSDDSQADAERLLGNQIGETSALARSAREAGAFAASSFGAGFGGSVWALVTADEAPGFCNRWIERYLAVCPGLRAQAFTMMPGPGMIAVPNS